MQSDFVHPLPVSTPRSTKQPPSKLIWPESECKVAGILIDRTAVWSWFELVIPEVHSFQPRAQLKPKINIKILDSFSNRCCITLSWENCTVLFRQDAFPEKDSFSSRIPEPLARKILHHWRTTSSSNYPDSSIFSLNLKSMRSLENRIVFCKEFVPKKLLREDSANDSLKQTYQRAAHVTRWPMNKQANEPNCLHWVRPYGKGKSYYYLQNWSPSGP